MHGTGLGQARELGRQPGQWNPRGAPCPLYPGLLGQEEAQSHQAPSAQDQVGPEGGDGIAPVFTALNRPEATLSMPVLGRQDEGRSLDRAQTHSADVWGPGSPPGGVLPLQSCPRHTQRPVLGNHPSTFRLYRLAHFRHFTCMEYYMVLRLAS